MLIKGSNPLTHYIYPVEDNATSSVLLGTKYLITDMFLLENNKIAIGVTSSATAQLPSSWQLCNFSSEESISCTIVDNLILTRSQCFDLDDEDSLSDLSNYTYLTYCDNDL